MPAEVGQEPGSDDGRAPRATGERAWSGSGYAGCGDSGSVSDSVGASGMDGRSAGADSVLDCEAAGVLRARGAVAGC